MIQIENKYNFNSDSKLCFYKKYYQGKFVATKNSGHVDIIKVNFRSIQLGVRLASPMDSAYLDPSPSS